MTIWEYKIQYAYEVLDLNSYGAEGWEIFQVGRIETRHDSDPGADVVYILYMKRPVK